MPAVIPAHVAIREKLRDSVAHALSLDVRLEGLIAERPSKPGGGFHGKIDFSQPPWHAPVAHVHLELHAFSRKLERELRAEQGLPWRYRGGSADNTRKALEAICRLAENADDFMVRVGARELDKWHRRALVALEQAETARRLPRAAGEPERPCPWCKKKTLRTLALKGIVVCIDPGCKDENGRKPKAELEYFQGEMVLRWQDGIIGAPPVAA